MSKTLRLVYKTEENETVDATHTLAEWATDWWYDCSIVPTNNADVELAELDGEDITDQVETIWETPEFEEIAKHFKFPAIHQNFIDTHPAQKYNSEAFKQWVEREGLLD